MKVGFVGAGRMGRPMVARLVEAGHDVIALGSTAEKRRELERLGASAVSSRRRRLGIRTTLGQVGPVAAVGARGSACRIVAVGHRQD